MISGWEGKVHHGDCIELMAKMPEGCVDLIVTSPPYNIKQSTGNGLRDGNNFKWRNNELSKGYDGHGDDMPHEEYVQWQRTCLEGMMRVLADGGAIFYNHKWRVQGGLLQDRADIVEGFPVRQVIIWQRKGGINFNRHFFLPTYEVIYLIAKPGFLLAEGGERVPDIWTMAQEKGKAHPAAFPVELPTRCIVATGAKTVLDPFMGSGTTAVAAKDCGCGWVGMEQSEKYCQLAMERIGHHLPQRRMSLW